MGGGGGGGKGGGGGESTTTSSAAPWGAQIPYLIGGKNSQGVEVKGVFPEAARLYESGGLAGDYYPNSTVADESGYTTMARNMINARATGGDANIDNAASSMAGILNGSAMAGNTGLNALNQYAQSTNPYIDSLYSHAADKANATINGNFSQAGRFGSGAQANAIADADQNLANGMYSNAYNQAVSAAGNAANAYNQGVNAQIAAASPAQSLSNQAYTDASQLAQAGSSLDDYNQSKVDADVDRWNYNQQKDMLALQNYLNLVGGSYGGQGESTTETDSGGKGGGGK